MVNNSENIDDNILADRIRDGDMGAFKLLYDRYSKKLYYFSLKYLHNTYEAEELVQSVFVSIWEHRKSLDASRSLKNYIYRSAVNYIYNYMKKEPSVRGILSRRNKMANFIQIKHMSRFIYTTWKKQLVL